MAKITFKQPLKKVQLSQPKANQTDVKYYLFYYKLIYNKNLTQLFT